jgi:hypothetical protein
LPKFFVADLIGFYFWLPNGLAVSSSFLTAFFSSAFDTLIGRSGEQL